MSIEADRGFRGALEAIDINQVWGYVKFGGTNPPAPQFCVELIPNNRGMAFRAKGGF